MSWAASDELHPDRVHREAAEGQLRQPQRHGVLDPLLDVGVGAVEAVELGDVVSGLVGEKALVAPAVGVDQRELGAGVGALASAEQPRALRPAGEVDQAGELTDVGLAGAGRVLGHRGPVLADRAYPGVAGDLGDRLAHRGAEFVPDREADVALAAEVDHRVHAGGRVAAHEDLPVHRGGRQLLQCRFDRRHLVGSGVGACVAGPQDAVERTF